MQRPNQEIADFKLKAVVDSDVVIAGIRLLMDVNGCAGCGGEPTVTRDMVCVIATSSLTEASPLACIRLRSRSRVASPSKPKRRAINSANSGVRSTAGFLGGGMTSWRQEGRDVERIERLPLSGLKARLDDDPDLQVLDVRERSEWNAGHIPESIFEPWHDIDGLTDGLDATRPIAVVCGSGERAAVGASLTQRFGADEVVHVIDGGVPEWKRLGLPVEPSS